MPPSVALDAPRLLTMNRGRIPKIVSVEKSVKKITSPNARIFLIPVEDDFFSPAGGWL